METDPLIKKARALIEAGRRLEQELAHNRNELARIVKRSRNVRTALKKSKPQTKVLKGWRSVWISVRTQRWEPVFIAMESLPRAGEFLVSGTYGTCEVLKVLHTPKESTHDGVLVLGLGEDWVGDYRFGLV